MQTTTVEYKLTQWMLSHREFTLIDGFNRYKLHQIICDLFDEACQFDIENRNNNVVILIKSKNEIKNPINLGSFTTKHCKFTINNEGMYKIKCNLNATKKINNGTVNGKKVPLIGVDQVGQWLTRKAQSIGISITSINVGNTIRTHMNKQGEYVIDSHVVEFICNVEDSDKFATVYMNGLGSSRKFGFGFVKVFTIY
jgi:CRISPR-associated protein Cas6/Cse3/CasE subtype I-E